MRIDTLTVIFNQQSALYKQLFTFIKNSILTGRFLPGDVLPASRRLAADMGISRTSVLNAYNSLLAEGYITSIRGSGYRINHLPVPQAEKTVDDKSLPQRLTERYLPFSPEPIDTSFFPSHKWSKIITRLSREKPESLLYTDVYEKFGNRDLREAICSYLYEKKGLNCTSEQIVITSGSMESLELCVNILTEAGEMLSIEDPCFPPMYTFLARNTRVLNAMSVDHEGACHDNLPQESKAVIITSGCQFPFGIIMSIERKMAFIQWANSRKGWIIEDDYDSDFNAEGSREPTLFTLDQNKRTLYLGSFSRLITSELRVGYIVLPEHLLERFKQAEYEFKVSYLPQVILAEFIKTGEFYRNLLTARKIYTEKKAFFATLLREQLSDYGYPFRSEAGSFVVFMLDPAYSDSQFAVFAKSKGLDLMPLSPMCHEVNQNGFLLGFIYFNREVLKKAVSLMKHCLALYCGAGSGIR
ncbi:PLP-dependent aminotransferase family protein [Klebsiella sp. I138]|uniref:MocR-like pyridoxine biosynthesis transcription factor PdxR n=1 Tax=Klebsiella sp. I138 TaxID=2755385 RepID=UPI003DA856F3